MFCVCRFSVEVCLDMCVCARACVCVMYVPCRRVVSWLLQQSASVPLTLEPETPVLLRWSCTHSPTHGHTHTHTHVSYLSCTLLHPHCAASLLSAECNSQVVSAHSPSQAKEAQHEYLSSTYLKEVRSWD